MGKRRLILIAFIVLTLISTAIATAMTEKWTANLTTPDSTKVIGKAVITSSINLFITSRSERAKRNFQGSIIIDTKNLPKLKKNSKGTLTEVYEAWLVDTHSGYKLSIGLFETDKNNQGTLAFKTRAYFTEYDKVVITKESFPDPDPSPSSTIVLSGDIIK